MPAGPHFSPDFECKRNKCLGELSQCYSGGTCGSDDCSDVRACTVSCVDIFGDLDMDCYRGCLSSGTEQSVMLYLDLELCIRENCVDAADFDVCAQQVLSNYCAIEAMDCSGDVG